MPLLIGVRLVSPPDRHCGRPLSAILHRIAGTVRPAPVRSALLLIGVAIPVCNKDRSRFIGLFAPLIRAALIKLKGGVTCVPPKLVATGFDVRARSDLAIRRLVHSDIVNNAVPIARAGVLVCTSGLTGEMQATLRNVRDVHR